MHIISYLETKESVSTYQQLEICGLRKYVCAKHTWRQIPKFNLNTWQVPGSTAWLIDTSDVLQSAQRLSSIFSD